MGINEIETPCIIVDYEKLIKNIEEMSNFAKVYNKNLRPMIKTHKSIEIAKIQKDYGIIGIQCAKLSEAEIFASYGFDDIFISSEIVDDLKIIRAKNLSRKIKKLILAVDSIYGVKKLGENFKDGKIFVRIEIDSGHHRCGIKADDVLTLYKEIEKYPGLIFEGVFTHGGQVYSSKSKEERESFSYDEANEVLKAKKILEENNIKCEVVSIGSTPSAFIGGKVEGITEIRPGNYVFYDYKQVKLGVVKIDRVSLFVLTQVISKPDKDRIIVDAGIKSLSLDNIIEDEEKIYGYILEHPNAKIYNLSEEHGWVKIKEDSKIDIGDKIKIIPVHSCLIMSNFDNFYLVKGNEVLAKYNIEARGKFE
jgi:D-serine deaminase-like pyridoxal phosphate-dependent protein